MEVQNDEYLSDLGAILDNREYDYARQFPVSWQDSRKVGGSEILEERQ